MKRQKVPHCTKGNANAAPDSNKKEIMPDLIAAFSLPQSQHTTNQHRLIWIPLHKQTRTPNHSLLFVFLLAADDSFLPCIYRLLGFVSSSSVVT